eukprot:3644065-Prymnesium_polylepis.1
MMQLPSCTCCEHRTPVWKKLCDDMDNHGAATGADDIMMSMLIRKLLFVSRSPAWPRMLSSLFVAATAQTLSAIDPRLQYTGRVAFNGSEALWEWVGVRVSVRLNCTAGAWLEYRVAAPQKLIPFPALE